MLFHIHHVTSLNKIAHVPSSSQVFYLVSNAEKFSNASFSLIHFSSGGTLSLSRAFSHSISHYALLTSHGSTCLFLNAAISAKVTTSLALVVQPVFPSLCVKNKKSWEATCYLIQFSLILGMNSCSWDWMGEWQTVGRTMYRKLIRHNNFKDFLELI